MAFWNKKKNKKKDGVVFDEKDLLNRTANIVHYNIFETPNNSSIVKISSGKALLKVYKGKNGESFPGVKIQNVFVPLKPEDMILRVDGSKEVNILKLSPEKLRPLKATVISSETFKDKEKLKRIVEDLESDSMLFTPMSHDEQVIYTVTLRELEKRNQTFFEKYGVVIITGLVGVVAVAMVYLMFDRSAEAVNTAYNIGFNNGYKAFMNVTSDLVRQTINFTQNIR